MDGSFVHFVSSSCRRSPRPAVALAVATEVAARDPPLSRAGSPVAGVPRERSDLVHCGPGHWPLSAALVQLQPRSDALDVASRVLRVRGQRHGSVSAIYAG